MISLNEFCLTKQSSVIEKCSKCSKEILPFYLYVKVNKTIFCKRCFYNISDCTRYDLKKKIYDVPNKYSEDELADHIKTTMKKGSETLLSFTKSNIYVSKNYLTLSFLRDLPDPSFECCPINLYTLKYVNRNLYILIKISNIKGVLPGIPLKDSNVITFLKSGELENEKDKKAKINSFLLTIDKLNIPENNILKIEIDVKRNECYYYTPEHGYEINKYKWNINIVKQILKNDIKKIFKDPYALVENIRPMNSFTRDWMVENILKGKTI